MKTKHLFMAAAFGMFAISLSSCKKDDNSSSNDDLETTFEISGDQAISDNLLQDANDVLSEAASDNGLMGNKTAGARPVGTVGLLSCATITITTPTANAFPKNILIDFGAGCTSANGIFRSGKINVVLSDSLRRSGSTAVMTFDNYYVNGFKKEGTFTWTNTSTASVRSWQRRVDNGKITAPDGRFWLHTAVKDVVHSAGASTPLNLLDDEYTITGTHTVTKPNGNSRTATILEPLHKKTICDNIDQGKTKIQGPNHFAIIDYGTGTCDRIATISIDGRTPRTILLR